MSRRFDRKLQVSRQVTEILNEPATIAYLSNRLIRRRPKYCPKPLWKILLSIVLAPPPKEPFQL